MKTVETSEIAATVTSQLLRSIRDHLQDQDFSVDQGEVKIVDSDESTVYFGLFQVDQESGRLAPEPELIWSIEVFADLEGGR